MADVGRSRDFYQRVFGLRALWVPDADNVYLTSGGDVLALHRQDDVEARAPGDRQALDHLGFLYASAEVVVRAPRQHRDGSFSFYCADPDGNEVQVLFEPHIAT
jgi:catechol 2,3-dioxygenase-like lactoylglutathione lyase family enzyme